jgi:murein DD-endopeptidase MepM/ murein hydrolase activator NlpD
MAMVPNSGNFGVMPSGQSGITVPTPSTAGFDRAGEQLQQVGRVVQQAAAVGNDIVIQQQQRANQLAVLEAENEAREAALRLTYDQNDGYSNVRGRDVQDRGGGRDLVTDYGQRYGQSLDAIGARLRNPVQRDNFAAIRQGLSQSFTTGVMRHQNDEYRTYQLSVFEGAINLASQEIAANANDVDAINGALDRQGAAVAELGALRGLSGNEITSAQNVASSRALRTAISGAMERDDLETAASLRERYGDRLVEEDRQAIDGPLRREREARDIFTSVDQAFGEIGETGGAAIAGLPLPVTGGRVTSRYGASRGNRTHNGVDIAVPVGTPVTAGANGTVERVWRDDRGGLSVIVRYADGSTAGFAHLDSADVQAGQTVRRGQRIARSGNSGQSTGPHLHYTRRNRQGQLIDPMADPGTGEGGAPAATVEDAYRAARDAFMARNPNASARALSALRQEVEGRWRMRESAEADAEDRIMEEVQQALIANGGNFSALPARLRSRIPADRYDDAMAFAERIQPRRERDDVADDIAYNNAITNPAALGQMSDSDFTRRYAGHPSFTTIANLRASVRNPSRGSERDDPGNLARDTINRVVTRNLQANGIPVEGADADLARVGAIRSSIDTRVASEQRRLGRAMTEAETQAFVERLFVTETVRIPGTFGGEGRRVPRLLIEVDQISPNDRRRIERQLRDARVPVTDANILRVYQSANFPRGARP